MPPSLSLQLHAPCTHTHRSPFQRLARQSHRRPSRQRPPLSRQWFRRQAKESAVIVDEASAAVFRSGSGVPLRPPATRASFPDHEIKLPRKSSNRPQYDDRVRFDRNLCDHHPLTGRHADACNSTCHEYRSRVERRGVACCCAGGSDGRIVNRP